MSDTINDTIQFKIGLSTVIPIMTKEKFSEMTGIPEGVIQGHINKGLLPTIKTGKRRVINVARITQSCIED